MALFRVSNERAQFDAAGNEASDQYGAGIRFTQGGNARVTTASPTNYNQGIPMSSTGQVAIVDATAGLPAGTIFHNGLPISGDKVCVSRNATAVVSNGLPFDSAGAVAADVNLDLNFIGTDTLNSSITFTRASTATYFNSAGVLTSAAIDAPRFDYNPATLAAQGLLIEEQRTNFFTNASGANGGAIGTGSVSGPDNVLCRTFIPTAGVASFPNVTGPTQSFSLTLGQTVDWAISGWFAVGPAGTPTLEPRLVLNVSVNNATSFTYFELQLNTSNWTVRTKVIPASGTEVSAPTITLFKPGLYRVTWVVRYTQDATGRNNVSASIQARDIANSGTYTADGVSGVQYSLVQVETGSFVTSTIPTTTTALTRSADVASVNTLSPWYNASEGTIYFEGSTTNTAEAPFFTLQNGGVTDFIRSSRSSNQSRLLVLVASGTVADLYSGNTITLGTIFKAAGAYKVNDFANVLNAGTPVVDTSGAVPTVTTLQLGSGGFLGSLGGYIRRITYYPRRLSNAELQAITT